MLIYVVGERGGADIKVGSTSDLLVRRIHGINGDGNNHYYVLLAALRGPRGGETGIQNYFRGVQVTTKGSRREYFEPDEALIEYVLWLRQLWFVTTDVSTLESELAEEVPTSWLPRPERRLPRPADDGSLFQGQMGTSPLAGTAWAFMPDPLPTFQDYFTPPDIVGRAWDAMGRIDLDAASHFLANQRFHRAGIPIGDFYSVNRSAFDFDWNGRVWLNPPYGDYGPWFDQAELMLDRGCMTQFCMLGPMWAFTTTLARSITRRAAASVVLTPTPVFWNPGNPLKTGSNLPHAIFYWGDRVEQFLDAFGDVGIPFELRVR